MSNSYLTLKAETKKELDAFPMQFAFNMRQFEEGMKSLGLTKDDTDKVYRLGGGGFIHCRARLAFACGGSMSRW